MNRLNIDPNTLEVCLKTIDDIGGTTYRNVCNGSQSVVPWGQINWVVLYIFVAVATFLTLSVVVKVYQSMTVLDEHEQNP